MCDVRHHPRWNKENPGLFVPLGPPSRARAPFDSSQNEREPGKSLGRVSFLFFLFPLPLPWPFSLGSREWGNIIIATCQDHRVGTRPSHALACRPRPWEDVIRHATAARLRKEGRGGLPVPRLD